MLAARATGFAGAPRAFAELSAIAPEGLIPSPGRGAVHIARQIERAADLAAGAGGLLGEEIIDAFEWIAGMIRRIAATSDALDARGAARAARRGIGTIRGLMAHTVPRDERWEAFRLGTYLPRTGWVTALARSAGVVSLELGVQPWIVAGAIVGCDGEIDLPTRIMTDRSLPGSAGHALAEAEAAALALDRSHAIGSATLPLAREAQTRLRDAAAVIGDPAAGEAAIDRLLDGIGALAESIGHGVAEQRPTPLGALRNPIPVG